MTQKWDVGKLVDGMESEDRDGDDKSNMDDLNYIHWNVKEYTENIMKTIKGKKNLKKCVWMSGVLSAWKGLKYQNLTKESLAVDLCIHCLISVMVLREE